MSTQRLITTPVTSSTLFFRYLAAAASRSCPHAPRAAPSRGQHSQSSKRELYTQPAYRPHSFPESFPPPPNPNSSTPGQFSPAEKSNTTQPSGMQQTSLNANLNEVASLKFPETQTPKTKSTDAPPKTSKAAPATEKPARKSKLRPRKAAMKISASAIEHLRELLSQPDPKLIRVGVKNRGCSGLAYHLEYVEKPGAFDEVVEQDGVKVLIDSKALFSIIGSEMDWQEDPLASRFIFKNPNIKEECGCGESFMV